MNAQRAELQKMYDQWRKNQHHYWYEDLCHWDIHEQLVKLGYAEPHPNQSGLFTCMKYRITPEGILKMQEQR